MRLTPPPPGALDAYVEARAGMFYPKADQPLDRLPEPALDHEPLAGQGTFHRLYALGHDRILRLNLTPLCDGAMLLAPWLETLGLPVCRQFECDLSRTRLPYDYEIVARGRGRPLAALDDDEPAMLDALRVLGRTVARLHAVTVAGFGWLDPRKPGTALDADWDAFLRRRLDDHIGACRDVGVIDAAEASRIERLFAAPSGFAGPARLLHGDLGSHNVLWDGEVTALLDFEDAIAGDPLYDLACWASFHPERRHAVLFEGYGRPVEMRRFWLYFLRVALTKTVVRARLNIADKPGRAPAARRIQLALERLA